MSDEQMILRSVTVREVMAGDGAVSLEIETEGEPAPWDVAGLLAAGVRATRIDLDAVWFDGEDEGDDE